MSRTHRQILRLVLLVIGVILAVAWLLYVPRDAETMFRMSRSRQEGTENYRQNLTAEASKTVRSSDVKGITAVTDESILVPVTVEVTSDVGVSGSHSVKKTSFTAFDQESSIRSTVYYDAKDGALYTRERRVWSKSESANEWVVSVDELLAVDASVLVDAEFGKDDGRYVVTVPAESVGNQVLIPFLKDGTGAEVRSGTMTYYFNRRSHRLEEIRSNEMMIRRATSKKDTDFKIVFKFDEYDRVAEEDYTVPESVIEKAEAGQNTEVQKEYTLSVADLEDNEMESYTVGIDLPKGKYKLADVSGAGIITCLNGTTAKERFKYNAGYDYYMIDDYEKGKEITLREGDRILLTGDKFSVVLKTKS